MLRQRSFGKRWRLAAGTLLAVSAASIAFRASLASDHQDTPEVELHPRLDINDVYAFPGTSADRIALVLTTSSPITPQHPPRSLPTFSTRSRSTTAVTRWRTWYFSSRSMGRARVRR